MVSSNRFLEIGPFRGQVIISSEGWTQSLPFVENCFKSKCRDFEGDGWPRKLTLEFDQDILKWLDISSPNSDRGGKV